MSGVRVLVGTRKGAFILTSDGKREQWDVAGPHFAGWEMYHLKGSPVDPNRIYASQSQRLVRPADPALRRRRQDVGARSATSSSTTAMPGTHQWYDGTPQPWEFKRVWHLEPSLTDPDTVYAGRRGRGPVPLHRRRPDLGRAGRPARPRLGPVLAAGRGRHVPAHDHAGSRPTRADVRRHLGRGRVPHRRRRQDLAAGQPRPALPGHPGRRRPRSATASTASRCTRRGPNVLFMQKHWDVMRTDDAGESWHEISGNLPTDFGFAIDVHAHEPETVYVVPIKSDSEHFPPDGKLRVYRSRTGGNEWEALTKGLPQSDCYVNVLARRDGRRLTRLVRRVLRHHRRAGLRVGRRRRQLDADRARSPAGAVGRSPDAAHDPRRAADAPAHARPRRRRGAARDRRPGDPALVLDALEASYPMLRGTMRDHVTHKRRPFVRFFACERGPVARVAGRAAARGDRPGHRAVPRRRGDGRRLKLRPKAKG